MIPMTAPTDEVAQARSSRLSNTWMINPLIAEIFQVLLDFGGSAHRDSVVAQVAWRRTRTEASPGLRREIVQAFDIHQERAREAGLPALMHRPFGDESQRWSVTPKVREFVDRYMSANGKLADVVASFEKANQTATPAVPDWSFSERLLQRRGVGARRARTEA